MPTAVAEEVPVSELGPCPHHTRVSGARQWKVKHNPANIAAELAGEDLPTHMHITSRTWTDHTYMVRNESGYWVYVSEPYNVDGDAIRDFFRLTEAGWKVSISAWAARHYPGRTVAIFLVPPKHLRTI